jgi:hypothetical protein
MCERSEFSGPIRTLLIRLRGRNLFIMLLFRGMFAMGSFGSQFNF